MSSTVRTEALFLRDFYVILGRWDKAPRNNHQIAGRYQAVISIFWVRSQPAYHTLAHQALVLSLLARNVWVRGCVGLWLRVEKTSSTASAPLSSHEDHHRLSLPLVGSNDSWAVRKHYTILAHPAESAC